MLTILWNYVKLFPLELGLTSISIASKSVVHPAQYWYIRATYVQRQHLLYATTIMACTTEESGS